ncbi:MAG: hypothetical protein ACI8P9_001994 [Parasphingorhabdus sp.]
MPVFKKSRLVHIHIPKTGGSFIERSITEIEGVELWSSSKVGPRQFNNRWFELQHLTLLELPMFAHNVLDNYHSFAVLRNPYERLVSEYLWRWRPIDFDVYNNVVRFHSFEAMIDAIPTDINSNWDYYISQANKQFANFLIHIRPQNHYVCKLDGSIGVDQLIKFETIDPDLNNYLSRFDRVIPHIRSPQKIRHSTYFHNQIVNLVNDIYAQDFEIGGYDML